MNMMERLKLAGICVVAPLAMAGFSATAAAAPVDLSLWTAESYPAVNGFGAGQWTVNAGNDSVLQSVNGQPTVFYSDFAAFGTAVNGTIRVRSSGGDDDYIGFVLGFRPGDSASTTADYLLVDWKRSRQNFDFGAPSASPGGVAAEGLAVSRVFGVPDADEFWQHANLTGTPASSGLEELARGATLGGTGWQHNMDYVFSFDFGPGNLQVYVDEVLQFAIAGSFDNGRLGFYNFSQAQVNYSAFSVEEGGFPEVPVPAAAWLFGSALIGLLGLARNVKKTA